MTVTGGGGFVGGSVIRAVEALGGKTRSIRSADFDLRDHNAALEAIEGSDIVIDLAARVGGIGYHQEIPAEMIRDNTLIAINVFDACRIHSVDCLITSGTVCSYPKDTPSPFREADIWNGYPEATNAPYGIAKRTAQVLADTYRRQYGLNAGVAILTSVYGPGDSFDLEHGHVLPSLVRKFVDATLDNEPQVTVWGSGRASREFLYVDDAAKALLLAAEGLTSSMPVNIGTGRETPIAELATTIATLSGFDGSIVWDRSKPDGQLHRRLDITRAADELGFAPEISLEEGLRRTIDAYTKQRE